MTYTWDADGNVATRSNDAIFTHDYRNRLTLFVSGGASTAYLYDSFGRRIRKATGGVSTWYLWDESSLMAEFDASGTRRKRYAYLGGDFAPKQVQDGNGTYYVHSDQLGTPRLMTDSVATVV